MTQKSVSEPPSIGGTLDETGDVGDDELKVVLESDDTEVRFKSCEGVIGNLGLGGRDPGDERRLTHIGKADEGHIGHQLEFEIEPLFLAHLTLFGEGRSSPDIRKEPGIALAAASSGCRHPAIAVMDQIGQHLAVEVVDHGALRDINDQIVSTGSVLLLSLPVHSTLGTAVRMVLKCQQGRDVAVGDEPDISAFAAISAIRTALGNMGFSSERHAARTAVAALDIQLALVDESRHNRRAYGLGEHSPPMESD